MRAAHGLQAEQVLRLVEHQQHARAGREPDDHRVRDVARQIAEPQHADDELDRAHQERDQDRRLDALVLAPPSDPIALSSAIEIALVGPLMSWRDESNSAPTAVMTIAV